MKKTITILGSLKRGELAFDGQTSKTRNYFEEIHAHYPDFIINEIDTQARSLSAQLLPLALYLLQSDIVFIFPGQRGLRVILPIVCFFRLFKHYLLLYPVVGGWLPDYIVEYRVLLRLLHSVDRVYVETRQMKQKLEALGYANIELAPVFTRRSVPDDIEWDNTKHPYSFCTFSRVTQTKGIDTAAEAVNFLNQEAKKSEYTLTVYGKIDPDYQDEFSSIVSNSPFGAVRYGGELDDDMVMKELASHRIMLFPTRYPGEGFPATLLEGMKVGLPIIASDWKYNSEIIENGYNGFLFDLKKGKDDLIDKIKTLVSNPQLTSEMHYNALKKSQQLTPNNVLKPMFTLIDSYIKERA